MEHLWAPWRNSYIAGDKKPNANIFSEIAQSSEDEANLVIHRSKACFSMLNKFPYNTGHLMVLPYRPVTELLDLSAEESANLWETVNLMTRLLKESFRPQGFNIGMNLGRTAGAGIDEHLHIHIVPRWNGDTNFMPIVAGTKLIPEALEQTYAKLRPLFAAI